MRLPCKVIEDLLPMYYDGVCSEESAALVEEHLKECPKCSSMLSQLQAGIENPGKQVDDLKPLKEIEKQWKNTKQTSMTKGICATLAALLLILSVWAGVWYFGYATYYTQLASKMEKITGEEAAMTTADYKKETEHYQYLLKMPFLLSDAAFVRVVSDTGMIMFFYPELGGEYSFYFMLGDESGAYKGVWLNPDLTPNYEDHADRELTDEEKAFVQKLLDEKQNEIIEMFGAVYELWGIQFLVNTP